MAEHKVYHGDAVECGKLIPLARHAMRTLKRRLEYSGSDYGEEHRWAPNGRVMAVYANGQEFLHIWAGALQFSCFGNRELEGITGPVTVASQEINRNFKPKLAGTPVTYVGNYFMYAVSVSGTFGHYATGTYPYGTGTRDVAFSRGQHDGHLQLRRPLDDELVASFPYVTRWIYPTNALGQVYYARSARGEPLQALDRNNTQLLVTGIRSFGAVDTGGVTIPEPYYQVWDMLDEEHPEASLFPSAGLPDGSVRHWETPRCITVGPGAAYVWLISRWTYNHPDTGNDGSSTIRVAATFNSGQTWDIHDISAAFKADMWPQPGPSAQPSEMAGAHNHGLNSTTILLEFVRLPGLSALSFTLYFTDSDVYASRLLRHTPEGTTILDSSPIGDFYFYQDMEHLGNGVVLAKKVYGFGGTGHAIEFIRSMDSGSTWTTLAASGLPVPRENQNFGNMKLVRAAEDYALVAIPVYDPAAGKYRVYGSADLGDTWAPMAHLASTDSFFRVDTMLAGDGGGNFGTINYFGTARKPAPFDVGIDNWL